MKRIFFRLLLTLMMISLIGCTNSPVGNVPSPAGDFESERSNKARITEPDVPLENLAILSEGNSQFAVDLYQQLRGQDGNLFYSPYSISLALAMVYAGARGSTQAQMAEVLHFDLNQTQLHAAFNALDLELASRSEGNPDYGDPGFDLNIANAVWGQSDSAFEKTFLDLLAENYGAGLRLLDFKQDPEAARQTINDWVSQETVGKIQDLISEESINSMTRMVLANAIYFNAAWAEEFNENRTEDAPFYLLDGSEINVSMMNQKQRLPYYQGEGFVAFELPYAGGKLSMLVLVPDSGKFSQFEESLDAGQIVEVLELLSREEVLLGFPKFTYESKFSLQDPLSEMGLQDAFNPGMADFSGIDGTRDLFIGGVVHQAFVAVDEKGTEAAAATAVEIAATSMEEEEQPIDLTVDRPYIFLIRDRPRDAVLFIGRVAIPQ